MMWSRHDYRVLVVIITGICCVIFCGNPFFWDKVIGLPPKHTADIIGTSITTDVIMVAIIFFTVRNLWNRGWITPAEQQEMDNRRIWREQRDEITRRERALLYSISPRYWPTYTHLGVEVCGSCGREKNHSTHDPRCWEWIDRSEMKNFVRRIAETEARKRVEDRERDRDSKQENRVQQLEQELGIEG